MSIVDGLDGARLLLADKIERRQKAADDDKEHNDKRGNHIVAEIEGGIVAVVDRLHSLSGGEGSRRRLRESIGDVAPGHGARALGGEAEAAEHSHGGGFAGTVGAEKSENLA